MRSFELRHPLMQATVNRKIAIIVSSAHIAPQKSISHNYHLPFFLHCSVLLCYCHLVCFAKLFVNWKHGIWLSALQPQRSNKTAHLKSDFIDLRVVFLHCPWKEPWKLGRTQAQAQSLCANMSPPRRAALHVALGRYPC